MASPTGTRSPSLQFQKNEAVRRAFDVEGGLRRLEDRDDAALLRFGSIGRDDCRHETRVVAHGLSWDLHRCHVSHLQFLSAHS